MTAGIYTVAYGEDYDRCAACAFRYGRKHTDLPIAVATNLRAGERCKAWAEVPNVTFMYFANRNQGDNRRAKLQMDLISPFERTLYIDADSVIQNAGVERFAPLLDDNEMVFNWRITFGTGDRIWNIYARCMAMFGVKKPISIYNGGIIAFRKTPAVREFFRVWMSHWETFGCGREMPPLNCTIKEFEGKLKYTTFPLLFFADAQTHTDTVIQHNYSRDFNQKFGIVPWTPYKPFDGNKNDFHLERTP
jgi:hypothetical protein